MLKQNVYYARDLIEGKAGTDEERKTLATIYQNQPSWGNVRNATVVFAYSEDNKMTTVTQFSDNAQTTGIFSLNALVTTLLNVIFKT